MPVEQRHIDFAQAVVQLAREHRMDNITVQFRESFHSVPPGEYFANGMLKMTWAEGRHGDTGRIAITYEATTSFDEKPSPEAGVEGPEHGRVSEHGQGSAGADADFEAKRAAEFARIAEVTHGVREDGDG